MADRTRDSIIHAFEQQAELLVVHHLDLIAQIEAQLRAVHHTMRRIERLRGAKHRVGSELSNGQRLATLVDLSTELIELDKHLLTERECCLGMQDTINQMEHRLATLKKVTKQLESGSAEETPDDDGSLTA